MKATVILTTALMLVLVSCQSSPSIPDTSQVQSSDTSSGQFIETPTVMLGLEMIEPTVALSTGSVGSDSAQIAPLPRSSDCPKLESRLYDLMVSENPEETANTLGLFYEDGVTRVIVQLVTSGASTSFVTEYGAQVETQTDALVQVLILLENLCDLSNDPQAKFVQSPRVVTLP